MKLFYFFSVCAVLTLPSCSSAQPTRVVYVPSPHIIEGTACTTTAIVAAQKAATDVAAVVTDDKTTTTVLASVPTSLLSDSATPQTSPFSSSSKRVNSLDEVTNAAAEDSEYSFRGEGLARSTNYSTAQREAMLVAKAALAARANEAVRAVAEQVSHNLSGATRTKFDDFIAGRTLAVIRRTRIVCFYSHRAAMNEYAVCVEARADDIACPIEELLQGMTKREVQEIQYAVQKAQDQPEAGSKEAIAQTVGKLADHVVQRAVNKYIP